MSSIPKFHIQAKLLGVHGASLVESEKTWAGIVDYEKRVDWPKNPPMHEVRWFAAQDLATMWWNETGQIGECQILLEVMDWHGEKQNVAVELRVELRARSERDTSAWSPTGTFLFAEGGGR